MGNMQWTQEHDLVARATASILWDRDEKKRPGWSWGGRGKRETVRLHPPHTQEAPPGPGPCPPFALVP